MDRLLVQAVGFVAMAFCIGSYQVKSGRGMILCKTAGDLLYIVHYLLLGAYSGCVTLGVSAVSQIACSFRGRKKWADWWGWRWLFTALLIIACLLVWRKSFRPIPCICAMISMSSVTLTTWTGNPKLMRLNKLVVAGPAWLLYSAAVGSWSGILCEIIGMASSVIAVLRYRRETDVEIKRAGGGKRHGVV